MSDKPNFRPTDFTHPNNDEETAMGSPLFDMAKKGIFGLPWPKKPIGKAKGKPGKPGPKTSRSGVHRLGRQKKNGSFY